MVPLVLGTTQKAKKLSPSSLLNKWRTPEVRNAWKSIKGPFFPVSKSYKDGEFKFPSEM